MKKTILVIEDQEPLTNIIKKKLKLRGFQVGSVNSVDDALSFLERTEDIDLIWLDHYLLGKENGLDFLTKIRKGSKKWNRLPVFVVATVLGTKEVEAYAKLGVERYYIKADSGLNQIVGDIEKFLFVANVTKR